MIDPSVSVAGKVDFVKSFAVSLFPTSCDRVYIAKVINASSMTPKIMTIVDEVAGLVTAFVASIALVFANLILF